MLNAVFSPSRPMSGIERVRYLLVRSTFTGQYRTQFYTALRFLLENDKPLEVALRLIGDVHTDFGARWHPYRELVDDCLESLADNGEGKTLEDVLAAWGPLEEAALINAGMRSGCLPEALQQADKLIDARLRIMALVLQMMIYPVLLLVLGGGLLAINSTFLIPTLRKLSAPENWTGALGFMNGLAEFTTDYGVLLALVVMALCLLVLWSVPRWCGRIRRIADRFIPWSVYKDIQGAVFLMSVAALFRANVKTLEALQVLFPFASPWLQERLDAIIDCVSDGDHLGKALRHCGYHFPSQEAANYLSLLTDGDGAPDIIGNYGDRWLEQTLARVKKRVMVVMFFSLISIFSFFLLVLAMVMQIQDMTHYSMQ